MTTPSSSGPSRAPWREVLDSHLSQTSDHEFTIGTIGRDDQNRPVPRVRTCGFRGFFPELTLHPSGAKDMEQQVEDGGNPSLYESDLFTLTTDVRMEKLAQLELSSQEIEAVFWLKDLNAQWRIKGKAFAIGNPLGETDTQEKWARSAVQKGLRVKDDGNADTSGKEKWSWEKAVTKYFANHSPFMRGSFRNPPPGQPRSQEPSDPRLKMAQKVTDLHDPVARANFRVVVIQPEEVERLDLTNPEDVRRWKWTLEGNGDHSSGDNWVETELWP
ncbi:uncharacterized protein PFLUO_LOCUS4802 [Penicillium psychrofluorescens]|uniref:uncharacterized protein n=1 Tax=Penicillium psychrofluorescens TaxID=3158075 RepID=UPI003CCE52AA